MQNNTIRDDQSIEDYQKVLESVIEKMRGVEEPLTYMVALEIGYEILDLKLSINGLLNSNCHAGILSLSRTMLENYIYLVYILSEDSFKRSKAYYLSVYREIDKQVRQQIINKDLKKMRDEYESFSKPITLHDTNKVQIESYLEELDSLYGHKLVPWYNDDKNTKNIVGLFGRVNKSYLYDGMYRFLSMEIHGANGFKHLKFTEDKEQIRLFRTNLNAEEISSITSSILCSVKNELEEFVK